MILTDSARVQCDITAKTVSIRGVYKGVLRADRVELLEGSQIYGSLNVNSFYMDDGVLLRAELNIQGAGNEKQFPAPRPDRQALIPVLRPRSTSNPNG